MCWGTPALMVSPATKAWLSTRTTTRKHSSKFLARNIAILYDGWSRLSTVPQHWVQIEHTQESREIRGNYVWTWEILKCSSALIRVWVRYPPYLLWQAVIKLQCVMLSNSMGLYLEVTWGTGGTALLLLGWNICLLNRSADLFLSRKQCRLG